MTKNIVIYYSRKGQNYVNGNIKSLTKGNTEICANFICSAIKSDIFEIETVNEYSPNYTICTEEAKDELNKNARPKLKQYIDNIDKYDNIFILGPCWWGTYPMAIFSQLEKLDFTGKTVAALVTHEGSGIASCETDLKKICKGAKFKKSLAVKGANVTQSKDIIVNWAKDIAMSDKK